MRRLIHLSLLLLSMMVLATSGLARSDNFDMPKDMVRLLPAEVDCVLALSSMDNLDSILKDLLPEEMHEEELSKLPFFQDVFEGLYPLTDPEKPLLLTLTVLPTMNAQGFLFTYIVPMKDDQQDLNNIAGFEDYFPMREGQYIALSSDANWTPAGEKPVWAEDLRNGTLSASIDLASIIKTYGFLIEMGLDSLNSQAQNGMGWNEYTSIEETMAQVKIIRALMESASSMEIVVDSEGKSIYKDFIFSTKPGSSLSPGPQPSFKKALNLTRFLPGGENLLFVSALDQSSQMELYADYYLASMHSDMALMDVETGERYVQWYTQYLNTMEISFLPSAMTVRVEKDNSSFQYLLESDYAQEDFDRMVKLTDDLHDIGSGINLIRMEASQADDHEILAWSVAWQEGELQSMMDNITSANPSDQLLETNLMGLLRFAPGNIYMAQVDNYILLCGGPTDDLMKKLVRNAAKGKGNVDPRVKKALKNSGPGMQLSTVGDLNAMMQVIMEISEELEAPGSEDSYPESETNWPFTNPLPFVQTFEIDGPDYLVHMEMEKAVLRELIKAWAEVE